MVSCFMRYARSLSSGASGKASRTALRPATDLWVKSSTESCSCSSAMALRALSLKPSTPLASPSWRRSSVSRLRAGFSVSMLSTSLSVVEHLGEMEDAGVVSRTPQAPFQVHQATRVARDQGVSPAVLKRLYLLVGHRRGDVGHLYGEGTPEPAAQFLVLPVHEVQPTYVGEQPTRLVENAQLAPLVASAMEDGPPFQPRPEVLYAHHVDQEVRELPHASRKALRTPALFRQVLEDERVVVGDHRGA